jgi:hypothetical protein
MQCKPSVPTASLYLFSAPSANPNLAEKWRKCKAHGYFLGKRRFTRRPGNDILIPPKWQYSEGEGETPNLEA